MSAEARRAELDLFCEQEIDAEALAARNPHCACECAKSPSGSPGPVQNEEIVRLFLASPSDIEGKRRVQREKRPFRAKSLQRAFTRGLSVVRLAHASSKELEYSASLLHTHQSGRDSKHGGLLSVVDFPVAAVRMCVDRFGSMCVFETPAEAQGNGSFKRPSHADIANSVNGLAEEAKKAKREVIYNRIIEQGNQLRVEDVDGCNLAQFLPEIVKNEGRAQNGSIPEKAPER